jgi:radical SAM-linked protein
MGSPYFRLRVGFRKAERLAFLSHLEVVRACERSARRARMPYAVTQGYNPKMRVAFGPALPVGTGSLEEYYDLWLREYVPPGEALDRLASTIREDLAPSRTGYVPVGAPSLSAELAIARYRVAVAVEASAQEVSEALEVVQADGELIVEHKGKTKVFGLADGLPEKPEVSPDGDGVIVQVTTRMSPDGTLRPQVLIGQALDRADMPHTVESVTRTALLAEDGSDWRRPLD